MKKIQRVRKKLMRDDTFLDRRKRYFGTFTLEKIPAFPMSEYMPLVVDSL